MSSRWTTLDSLAYMPAAKIDQNRHVTYRLNVEYSDPSKIYGRKLEGKKCWIERQEDYVLSLYISLSLSQPLMVTRRKNFFREKQQLFEIDFEGEDGQLPPNGGHHGDQEGPKYKETCSDDKV